MNVSNDSNGNESISKVHDLMKRLKFLEEDRKKSFKEWQYDENENCSVEKVNYEFIRNYRSHQFQIFIADGSSWILLHRNQRR